MSFFAHTTGGSVFDGNLGSEISGIQHFALSAPIGALHRAADVSSPTKAAIALTVNGEARQSSDVEKLIWSVSECIAHLSQYEALKPGDLIMTGTPEGVNAVRRGDVMRGSVQGLGEIVVTVAA